ncbi:TlpA family protein disulfide reductase [Streptoalloteichus hindustanus]|uniref:Thiol-disulfide isomerase or thioredoxin n=1 Tax=Streptoalloteichus hindustanus TaxID=2017 RepID=A0A1M4TVP1_STRHI|nr:TlpA disulfide reductase family protein [Streptoalloteichus hindustanus]SHE48377.1 Thiol-disulfide isomerase or thioredoxin [Streptoalloteichus hindustanus]
MTTRPVLRRLGAALVAGVATVAALTGCSTGGDAVATGGDFQFVAPGGQTRIRYEPADRQKAPEIAGESLAERGKRISVADYAGKVVVINLWGSWCAPCRGEADDLERVAEATKGSGVQFLGVNVRDDRSAAEDFARNNGITFPSLFDPPGRSLLGLKGYPRNTVPSTIVLDRQHRVAAVFLETLLDSDLRPAVEQIAAEPA